MSKGTYVIIDNVDIATCTISVTSENFGGLAATIAGVSTIKNCDRILVMDKGQIVEEGTYDALMEKKGMFIMLLWIKK